MSLKSFTDEHLYKNRYFIIKAIVSYDWYYLISVYENGKIIVENSATISMPEFLASNIRRVKKSLEDYVDTNDYDLLFLVKMGES